VVGDVGWCSEGKVDSELRLSRSFDGTRLVQGYMESMMSTNNALAMVRKLWMWHPVSS
jgi:hypothetical protein